MSKEIEFKIGENLLLENADGVKMRARVTHTLTVNGVWYAITLLETGLTVSYSFKELDAMTVYTW